MTTGVRARSVCRKCLRTIRMACEIEAGLCAGCIMDEDPEEITPEQRRRADRAESILCHFDVLRKVNLRMYRWHLDRLAEENAAIAEYLRRWPGLPRDRYAGGFIEGGLGSVKSELKLLRAVRRQIVARV